MIDYIIQYKEELFRVLSVFVITMGAVYALGRMLEILKTNRQKNSLALFFIISMNIMYSYYTSKLDMFPFIWEVLFYSGMCILLYVLVGFKLYNRADSFLDDKIGKDKKR